MTRRVFRTRPGFNLVELAAVVVVLVILIGLLLPAVRRRNPDDNMDRFQSATNLKQIGIALYNYAEVNLNQFPNVAPPNAPYFFSGQTGGTATRAAKPSLAPEFQNGLLAFMEGNVKSLVAPRDPNVANASIPGSACSYSIPAYWTTMTTKGILTLPSSFQRGTSQCIGAAEMTSQNVNYANIVPFALKPYTPAVANTPSTTANSFFSFGCQVLMVDGSVRIVTPAVNGSGDFVLAQQPDDRTAFSPSW
jgi:hypothetical protein